MSPLLFWPLVAFGAVAVVVLIRPVPEGQEGDAGHISARWERWSL